MTESPLPELPDTIEFRVLGTPGAQGSKKAFAIRKGGVLTGKVAMSENSKKVAPWRSDVKQAAEDATGTDWVPWDCACEVSAQFVFKRPKSHYGTGRNANVLKSWAPKYVTVVSLGDLDKLLRSTGDALTASGLFRDDCLIARYKDVEKIYGDKEGATLIITKLSEDSG